MKSILQRIQAVAAAIQKAPHPRISMRKWPEGKEGPAGFHLKLDGHADIATVNGTSYGCASQNLATAEELLKINPEEP